MSNTASVISLDVPAQDWDAPRFCAPDPSLLASWADSLPRTNLGETTRALYGALKELNRSRIEPRQRLNLLEVLRPVVYTTCTALRKHFFNQPIVLPPQSFQVFRLAQVLQLQLAAGYQIVASESAGQKSLFGSKQKHAQLTATALHRALSEYTQLLFRASLIYTEPDKGLWRRLHRLYQFGLAHELSTVECNDPEADAVHPLTVEQCYLRALLLGCVRTNQLRQQDMLTVMEHIDAWVPLASLQRFRVAEDDLIAINLASDDCPVYNALFKAPRDTGHCRLLDTGSLLKHLAGQLKTERNQALSADLVKHLMISWGSYTKRAFMRMDSSDSLALCIGLSHLHYFAADGIEFEDFLKGHNLHVFNDAADPTNPFLKSTEGMRQEEHDVWSSPHRPEISDANVAETSVAMESIDQHIQAFEAQQRQEHSTATDRDYQIRMVNVSPGGYCLQWPSDVHARLSNGDVVGIRETNHANWSMGVVTWLRRAGEQISQLGIKLTSPSVIPYGAHIINRPDAPADYQRVLMLPEIKLIGQPATLITAKIPFREGHKLQLVQQGRQTTVLLTRLIHATGAFNQFEFDVIEKSLQDLVESADTDTDFDALWDAL